MEPMKQRAPRSSQNALTGKGLSTKIHQDDSVGWSNILLPQIDFLMPLPPNFGGSEHTSGAALITKGSLTSSVGSSTGNTRYTSHGTA